MAVRYLIALPGVRRVDEPALRRIYADETAAARRVDGPQGTPQALRAVKREIDEIIATQIDGWDVLKFFDRPGAPRTQWSCFQTAIHLRHRSLHRSDWDARLRKLSAEHDVFVLNLTTLKVVKPSHRALRAGRATS